MTVDREAVGNDRRAAAAGSRAAEPVRDDQVDPPPVRPVSRATVAGYATAGVVLTGWFFFGWLVLEQGLINSAGESLGAGFALLLLISIIGTVRRDRR